MDPQDLPSYLNAWLGFAITAAGVLAACRKRLQRRMETLKKFRDGLVTMVAAFPSLIEDVGRVKSEVEYNGGGSNKDMLRKIVLSVDYLMADRRVADFSSDDQGAITRVSSLAVEVLRCQREELLGYGWKSFIAPGQIEHVSAAWASIVRDGRSARIDDVTVMVEEEPKVIDIEAVALKDSSGRFAGHQVFVRRANHG